jgi:hypothetical protein
MLYITKEVLYVTGYMGVILHMAGGVISIILGWGNGVAASISLWRVGVLYCFLGRGIISIIAAKGKK